LARASTSWPSWRKRTPTPAACLEHQLLDQHTGFSRRLGAQVPAQEARADDSRTPRFWFTWKYRRQQISPCEVGRHRDALSVAGFSTALARPTSRRPLNPPFAAGARMLVSPRNGHPSRLKAGNTSSSPNRCADASLAGIEDHGGSPSSADHFAARIGNARPFRPGSFSVWNIQSERGLRWRRDSHGMWNQIPFRVRPLPALGRATWVCRQPIGHHTAAEPAPTTDVSRSLLRDGETETAVMVRRALRICE